LVQATAPFNEADRRGPLLTNMLGIRVLMYGGGIKSFESSEILASLHDLILGVRVK
jgi:hypothetical protein